MLMASRCRPVRRGSRRLVVASSAFALILALTAWNSLCAQQTGTAASQQNLPDAPGMAETTPDGVSQSPATAGSAAPAVVAGTVVDTNQEVVEGAKVVLSAVSGGPDRVIVSGSNGEFTFTELQPDSYRLTVSRSGMGSFTLPDLVLHAGEMRYVRNVVLPVNGGVQEVRVYANEEQIATEQVHAEESQRVLGVIPNFYSSFDWHAVPLHTKQKLQLAFRSEIDPITFAGAVGLAGAEEYKNIYPGYGKGFAGFGKRFAAQYANDFDSRMIGSAVLPSLFRQDPRYFYKGTGTIRSRTLYAIKSAFICRGDNGKPEFDFSHIVGDFAAGSMSNLYYPEPNEGATLILTNGLIEIAGMAGTNLMREFVLRGITSHVPVNLPGNH